MHHSSLGSFLLPEDIAAQGPATLLVRKERLALTNAAAATATATGRVVKVRQSGPHQDVLIEFDHSATGAKPRVVVEARLGTILRPGDRTGVAVPPVDGLWVVPGATTSHVRGCDAPVAFSDDGALYL